MTDSYLIEVDSQKREAETIRRFCGLPFLVDDLLAPLGLPPGFFWVMLGVPHRDLIATRQGDVDLLAGALAWNDSAALAEMMERHRHLHPDAAPHLHAYAACREYAAVGGLQWPPPLTHLVAIETKCAYFDPQQATLKSQKAGEASLRGMRAQVDELLDIFLFNRVALLDFIVNPPTGGGDGQAWIQAAGVAAQSLHAMRPALQRRLPTDSPAGHFVMSWGSVDGATESWRGAGAPTLLRPAHDNPRLHDANGTRRREQLEEGVRQLTARRPQPLSFPVVIDYPVTIG